MSNVAPLNFFCAVPGRAVLDDTLTALDLRVLMVIASRDRMGRNGQLCWERPEKLAARIKCHPKRFRQSIGKLIEAGYLREGRSEHDGRRKGWAVFYDAEQDAPGIGVDLTKTRERNGSLSRQTREPTRSLSQPNEPASNPHSQRALAHSRDDPNIFSKTGIYIPEGSREAGKSRKLYGPDTHSVLAERFGGWEPLLALSHDTIVFLERCVSDGTLTDDDVANALREAQQAQRTGAA